MLPDDRDRSALRFHGQGRREGNPVFPAVHHKADGIFRPFSRLVRGVMAASQKAVEGKRNVVLRFQLHHHALVREGRIEAALVAHAVHGIGHARNPRFQIQLPSVILHVRPVPHLQIPFPRGLIGALGIGRPGKGVHGKLLRLLHPSLPDQPADHGEIFLRVRIDPVQMLPAPDTVLI